MDVVNLRFNIALWLMALLSQWVLMIPLALWSILIRPDKLYIFHTNSLTYRRAHWINSGIQQRIISLRTYSF